MKTIPQEIQRIELTKLHPHPKNANIMPPPLLKKLRTHIEKTCRYEPLIVRPHPSIPRHFELINGHHRKLVLEQLRHSHANCLVWNLSDAETLLLLATINRLSGQDSPSKRLSLLEDLAHEMQSSTSALADLLPESQSVLHALLQKTIQLPSAQPPIPNMPEAFTIFLPAADKQLLLAALKQTHPNPATALMQWAKSRPPDQRTSDGCHA